MKGQVSAAAPTTPMAPVAKIRKSRRCGSLPPEADKVPVIIGLSRSCQSLTERKRKALLITDTDDRLMAAAAKIGEINMPKNG